MRTPSTVAQAKTGVPKSEPPKGTDAPVAATLTRRQKVVTSTTRGWAWLVKASEQFLKVTGAIGVLSGAYLAYRYQLPRQIWEGVEPRIDLHAEISKVKSSGGGPTLLHLVTKMKGLTKKELKFGYVYTKIWTGDWRPGFAQDGGVVPLDPNSDGLGASQSIILWGPERSHLTVSKEVPAAVRDEIRASRPAQDNVIGPALFIGGDNVTELDDWFAVADGAAGKVVFFGRRYASWTSRERDALTSGRLEP